MMKLRPCFTKGSLRRTSCICCYSSATQNRHDVRRGPTHDIGGDSGAGRRQQVGEPSLPGILRADR
eukprot:6212760-Pleurochrysis_carterae.AAC.3